MVNRACQRGALAAFAVILLSAATSYGAAATWKGLNGLGGDGTWVNSNFDPTGTPGSTTDVFFTISDTYTAPTAQVTISGTTPKARSIVVTNGKRVVLSLSSGAMLTVGTGVIGVGANTPAPPALPPAASSPSLTIEGPASGSATLNAARLFSANNTSNVGTSHQNELILSGSNLTVNLNGGFNNFNGRSSVTFNNGVTVNTTSPDVNAPKNGAGAFYARAGKVGSVYDNYIAIINGSSLAAGYIEIGGLLQLGHGAVLKTSATATATSLKTEILSGGRFELEGSGLGADTVTNVAINGTLAVGLSNPVTGVRTAAGSLTLNSQVKLQEGSFLELGIFGPGANGADKITLGETGWIENFGKGALLVLTLQGGFTPEAGQSYTLFDIDPLNAQGIVGNFDLSGIDTTIWDLSNFNEAGGWAVTSIPEPGTNALLGILAIAGCCWKLTCRNSKARC